MGRPRRLVILLQPQRRPPRPARQDAMEERMPARQLNAYLWHRWSEVTWGKGDAHSGYRHLAGLKMTPGHSKLAGH
jgi:hypothetical protein